MKTVVYNYTGSKLNRTMEGMALKAGYMLFDTVISAGSTCDEIFIDEFYKCVPFNQKLQLLKIVHKNNEEWLQSLTKFEEGVKLFNKMKPKTHRMIISYKLAEKLINTAFTECINFHKESLKADGLELKELVKKDVFDFFMTPGEDAEGDEGISASKIFLRTLPGFEEETGVFFLPADFFEEYLSKKIHYYSSADREAANENETYLDECFVLPALNSLSITEIEAMRIQLNSSSPQFANILNEWIKLCSCNQNTENRLTFFKNKLMPATEVPKKLIRESDILQHCQIQQKSRNSISILIGEMPIKELWKLYRHWNVIKDPTWDILEKLQSSSRYDLRWPVIALKANYNINSGLLENKADDTVLITQLKRSITVD